LNAIQNSTGYLARNWRGCVIAGTLPTASAIRMLNTPGIAGHLTVPSRRYRSGHEISNAPECFVRFAEKILTRSSSVTKSVDLSMAIKEQFDLF